MASGRLDCAIQTAIVATNSEAASAEVTSEGGETASDSADIGDANPAQAPDDGRRRA
jgi:hypothetical protein